MTRARLEEAVLRGMESAAASPMQWGKDDCALWFANVVKDALGYDPAKPWRTRYRTRRGAMRSLGRLDLLGAFRKAARTHGWKRISPALAQVGDAGMAWVVMDGKPVLAAVICRARGWFVGRAERGYTALPADRVAVAWSVLPDALSGGPGPRVSLRSLRPHAQGSVVLHAPVALGFAILDFIGVVGASTFVAGAVGLVASVAVGVAISIGVSLVSSLLRPSAGAGIATAGDSAGSIADTSPAASASITERQAVPFKRVIVGRAYVGGALFYEQVTPPYLMQGVLINSGPIDAIERLFIGTDEIQFGSAAAIVPYSIIKPIGIIGQSDYPTHLRVSFRYGAADQAADPLILGRHNVSPLVTAILGSVGTTIGNMTNKGGIAAAFDGFDIKSASLCANNPSNVDGTIGKSWGAPKTIAYVVFRAPVDGPVTGYPCGVFFEGSNDGFATSHVLYTAPPTVYAGGSSTALQSGVDTSAAYSSHRLRITGEDTGTGFLDLALDLVAPQSIAQVIFYEMPAPDATNDNSNLIEFRQRGIATAVYEYDFGTDQADFIATWGNVSRPTAYTVARGVQVYDPRDPTQSLTDETTWKWSNNASLIQAWYLTRDFGGRIPKAQIRWDKIATSANWDDTLMGCNDGTTIAKHTIDGVITLSQQPFAVMQDMLTANRGMVLESGGSVWIESSRPKTLIGTIHDRILAGGITYQAGPQKADLVNKLQVRFVSPDQDYQVVDGPILSRTDLQTADGEVLTATLALNYTTDQRRAQRLQKCFLESSRLGRTLQATVNLSFMATVALNSAEELIGQVVTFNSQLFSNANGDYLITAVGFADDCTTLSLALAQYDPTIETNWNPETDEQPFVLADINVT